jgi:hypothetical protein
MQSKEVLSMRGIKLNDIPMDLFLKYFSKEDLQDNYLEPKYVDEIRKVFKYTLSISSDTYYYYSSLNAGTTSSNGPDYTPLREIIAENFVDILPSITPSGITVSSVDSGVNFQIYDTLGLTDSRPYRYVLEIYVDGPTTNTIIYFPSISGSGLTNSINGNLEESTNYTIKDDRNNLDVFGEVIYLQASTDNNFYSIYLGSDDSLVGYLFVNNKSIIQDVNNKGELLYVNESGNNTTNSLRQSNFLRHSGAIRNSFFNRPTFENLMSTTFQPGVISLLGADREEYLAVYESFNRKIEMVEATFANTSGSFQNRLISTEIKNIIAGKTVFTEIDNLTSVKYRTLLDIFNIPTYEALEIPIPYRYKTLSFLEEFEENTPIIIKVKRQTISLLNEEYPILIQPDGTARLNISGSKLFNEGTYNLQLTETENDLLVSIPIYKTTFGNIRLPYEKKTNTRVVIDKKTYLIYVDSNITGVLSYRIDFRVKRNTYDTSKVLIGSVKKQNGKILDLRSLYIEENPINITDEFFDLTGFTENLTNN